MLRIPNTSGRAVAKRALSSLTRGHGQQEFAYVLTIETLDQDSFGSRLAAADERKAGRRNSQRPGDEFQQRLVRRAVDWRRHDAGVKDAVGAKLE